MGSHSLLQGIFLTQGSNFGNVHYFENLRALQNDETSTFPVPYQWNNKAWIMAHLFTTWVTEYFKLTVETYCLEKKIPFKILPLTDSTCGHPGDLTKMCDGIHVIFLPSNIIPILLPTD